MSNKKPETMLWCRTKPEELRKELGNAEFTIKEIYIRSVKEILESFGTESFAVDRLYGALTMVEKYQQLCDEQD